MWGMPRRVVAGVELPGAIECGGGFAEAVDDQRRGRGGLLCLQENGRKEQQRQKR